MRKKTRPVTDPVRDAEALHGIPFERKRTAAPWQEEISMCTTGQFGRLDDGYHRHCGPTAITNLILTLNRRYGYLQDPVPAEIFSGVAAIGRKRGIYWNTNILGRFGGTYDILTDWYIRACLKQYGIPQNGPAAGPAERSGGCGISEKRSGCGTSAERSDGNGPEDLVKHPVTLRWRAFPSETQFIRELDAGRLLFLQLHRHPCYGSHHLLCYGYTTLVSSDRSEREIYLLLADGWNRRTRYLRLKSRGICHFFTAE